MSFSSSYGGKKKRKKEKEKPRDKKWRGKGRCTYMTEKWRMVGVGTIYTQGT